ncbi:polyhydroxyalkanoate depolymerase [Perkinsela sp. CCAP 1560/4]|nr:polyhydroxyalkanoate depolymerase [Perkinsela sp. CCAP 1560/4]|eukprot:KNH05056.1 polyhydroxyalkanoate depolymerase [Perkinsela sp. CCAP 1560/4]
MHPGPQSSLLSIERELQLIDEEFSNSIHGQQGTAYNQADASALFQEIGHALDLQRKRSEQMIQNLEESFHEEENALDFPVHTGHAIGEDSEESLQKFMQDMHNRDNVLRSFQDTIHESLKHVENIQEITLRGNGQNGG